MPLILGPEEAESWMFDSEATDILLHKRPGRSGKRGKRGSFPFLIRRFGCRAALAVLLGPRPFLLSPGEAEPGSWDFA